MFREVAGVVDGVFQAAPFLQQAIDVVVVPEYEPDSGGEDFHSEQVLKRGSFDVVVDESRMDAFYRIRRAEERQFYLVVDVDLVMVVTEDFEPGVLEAVSDFCDGSMEIQFWAHSGRSNQFKVKVFTEPMIHLQRLRCAAAEIKALDAVKIGDWVKDLCSLFGQALDRLVWIMFFGIHF